MELTVYRRILLNAVEVAGTEKKLAQFLGVPLHEVRAWATGATIPPVKVLLVLQDIVSADVMTPAVLENLKAWRR